jgi:hypothetical protein
MTREEFSKISAKWCAMLQIEQLLDKEFLVKAVLPMEKHRFISIFEYEDVSSEIKAKVQQVLDRAQHDVISLLRQEHIRLSNEFFEIKVEIKPTSSDHE